MNNNYYERTFKSVEAIRLTGINENLYKDLFKSRGHQDPIFDPAATVERRAPGKREIRQLQYIDLFFVKFFKTYQNSGLPFPFFQGLYTLSKWLMDPEYINTPNVFTENYPEEVDQTFIKTQTHPNKERMNLINAYKSKIKTASRFKINTYLSVMGKGEEVWLGFKVMETAISKDNLLLADFPIFETHSQPIGFRWSDKRKRKAAAKSRPAELESRTVFLDKEFMDFFTSFNLNNIRASLNAQLDREY
jgi:hypothetical protein